MPALEELLPSKTAENLFTNSVNYETGDQDEIAFVDGLTGERKGAIGGVPSGDPGSFLRVSRKKLRSYLWTQNNLPVSAGRTFVRYEEDEKGVTAYFRDGSTVRGSLLVGADGIHSRVLDQLIGSSNHKPTLSKHVPVFGEVDLPPSLYEPLRLLGNAAILSGAPGVRQQLGMLSMNKDGDTPIARYFWALMPHREHPTELSDWVQQASKQELYDFALEITSDLHPSMTDLIRYGGPEALAHPQPRFLEFIPPENLPEGRVTVLGDAAHAMIPFRGEGANTAMLDACDMARLILKAHEDNEDVSSILPLYHRVMIPRGKENVLTSRAAGEGEANADFWAKKFQRSN